MVIKHLQSIVLEQGRGGRRIPRTDGVGEAGQALGPRISGTSTIRLCLRALRDLSFSGLDKPASSLTQQKCYSRCVLDKTKPRRSKGIFKKNLGTGGGGAVGRKERNENLTAVCL